MPRPKKNNVQKPEGNWLLEAILTRIVETQEKQMVLLEKLYSNMNEESKIDFSPWVLQKDILSNNESKIVYKVMKKYVDPIHNTISHDEPLRWEFDTIAKAQKVWIEIFWEWNFSIYSEKKFITK
jgi:hypothetical protein